MAATEENPNAGTKPKLAWRSSAVTHVGKVRKHNEDAVLDRGNIGLWVVADGMGGHSAGDYASALIVKSLEELAENASMPEFVDAVEDKVLEVNAHLVQKATEGGQRLTIGSTVVAMIAYADVGLFLWAGDSRLYRLRNNTLQQMTTDHSQVEVYVEQGLMTREQASNHPHGNMITRAVGAADKLFIDMDMCSLKAGDRFLLCSDGLTKHLEDAEIRDMLGHGSAEETCHELLELTLSRRAADNVTVIVVDIEAQ